MVLKVAVGPPASTSSERLLCWLLAAKMASLCGKDNRVDPAGLKDPLASLPRPQPHSPDLVWRFYKGDFLLEREHLLSVHSVQ